MAQEFKDQSQLLTATLKRKDGRSHNFVASTASGAETNVVNILRHEHQKLNNNSKRTSSLRVVEISSVALTTPELHTWLQVHEFEMMKMRNLFARKSPTAPEIVTYVDATFRQIASFAQIHVLQMSAEERKRGIKIARKLSAVSSAKKKAGSETRAVITRILDLNFLGREKIGDDQDRKKTPSQEATKSTSAASDKSSISDNREDKDTQHDVSSPGSSSVSAQDPAQQKASVSSVSVQSANAASADVSADEKRSWFGFGRHKNEDAPKTIAMPAPALAQPSVPAEAAAPSVAGALSLRAPVVADEEWSSDEDWEAVKVKLQVQEARDAFYIYSNGHKQGASSPKPEATLPEVAAGASPRKVPVLSINSLLRARNALDNDIGVPSGERVIVNCLDLSLNRFRFLDFAESSSKINWSVEHIVVLNLSGNLLVSLEGIAACKNLRVLSCNDNLLTSMTPLRGCKFLRRLKISGNRLISLSLLNDADLCAYYEKEGSLDGDINIDDFEDDAVLADDYIYGLDDAPESSSAAKSDNAQEIKQDDIQAEDKSPGPSMHGVNGAEVKPGNALDKTAMQEKTGDVKPTAKDAGHTGKLRLKKSPNALGLPELEYLDASDNALESIEGIRLYSRNSLQHLELRNCELHSYHLNHLRALPLVTLRLDDNKIDNLKHTVAVLKSVTTMEHLSLLGNPIARNVDRAAEPCVNGLPKNNFANHLNIEHAAHFKSAVARARESSFLRDKEPVPSVIATLQKLASGKFSSAVRAATAAVEPKVKDIPSTNKPSALNPEVSNDMVSANLSANRQKRSFYAITILDHVDTLKTFDHLPVPPAMYAHLRALKAQVQGEVLLLDIQRHYNAEIASIDHVHANLAGRHRQNEDMVKQVVREKASRLEEEMETLLKFARGKLAEFQPDAVRKIFESRQAENLDNSEQNGGSNEETAEEASWSEELRQREMALPAKNLSAIRQAYAVNQKRLQMEKLKEAENDRAREIRKQEALSKVNNSIL